MENTLEHHPMVSVVVPVYNAEKYLRECLASLQAQRFMDYEVILINDGSTDRSAEICREFAEKDARFRLFSQKNRGVSAARNAGMDQAKGKYIQFVDSDDSVSADYVETLMQSMEQGCDLAVCNYYECSEAPGSERPVDLCIGRVSLKRYALQMALHPISNYYTVLWNRIFRAEIIRANNIRFEETESYGEDFAFVLRYLRAVKCVQTIPEYLYYYGFDRANSLSNGKRDERQRVERAAFVYRNYATFWKEMGWYRRCRPLIQLLGARLYFEELRQPEFAPYKKELYQRVLKENGFNRMDFLFFSLLRRIRKALKH